MARMTSPRLVMRSNAIDSSYVQVNGSWGEYATAKRFADAGALEEFAARHGLDDSGYGIFPCSVPRRRVGR